MFSSVIYLCIFAVFFSNALAISDEQCAQIQTMFLDAALECNKDQQSFDDLTSLRQRVFLESGIDGCFSACIFNKIGLFDDKGILSHTTALESARKFFDDDQELKSVEEFLTTCSKVNDEEVGDGEQGCERAVLTFDCFADNYKKFNIDLNI